jgi:hypothetical protein
MPYAVSAMPQAQPQVSPTTIAELAQGQHGSMATLKRSHVEIHLLDQCRLSLYVLSVQDPDICSAATLA